jgi:signal transduction histidine kinase
MSSPIAINYRSLFQHLPGLYLILDPELVIAEASEAYLEATMTSREGIVGRHIFDVFPDNPGDESATGVSNLRASLNYVLLNRAAHRMAVQKYDIRKPDGRFEARYWDPFNKPLLNQKMEVEFIIHQVEDVTKSVMQEQRFESELQRQRDELREQLKVKTAELTDIFERITDGFIALDKDFRYIYANKVIGEMIRRDPDSLVGRSVWEEFPDAVGSPTYQSFLLAMKEQRYICNTDYYEPLDLWQENHIYPSPLGISVFIRDVSARMRAEEQLKETNRQLRQLTSHLERVREEEQKRIAREIHDELGQQVTGLKMDVSWVRKKIGEGEALTRVDDRLVQMSDLVDSTIQTIRKISSQLRPRVLDDFGLVTALEWQSGDFEKRFSIPVKFTSSVRELEVPTDLATGLFRAYQESLTNIARHAEANEVTSSLQMTDSTIVLSIHDNGKGFDVRKARTRNTLGLLGMEERVRMMNGDLDIFSKPGQGTAITISVPVGTITIQ